jgi:hypothetical protein
MMFTVHTDTPLGAPIMRIHTDTLLHTDIIAATHYVKRVTGSAVTTMGGFPEVRGSRSHAGAYEVYLMSDGKLSRRRTMRDRDCYAATYEQWGWFLAYLYAIDQHAKAGPYNGSDAFDSQTRYAFELSADDAIEAYRQHCEQSDRIAARTA